MSDVKGLTCIGCPMGCQLTVNIDGGNMTVSGNTCKRGEDYARKELTHPTRIVTGIVNVEGGDLAVVSVKTAADIPKESIFVCLDEIRKSSVKAPVKIGDVIIENVADTGVNVIATKNINLAI